MKLGALSTVESFHLWNIIVVVSESVRKRSSCFCEGQIAKPFRYWNDSSIVCATPLIRTWSDICNVHKLECNAMCLISPLNAKFTGWKYTQV